MIKFGHIADSHIGYQQYSLKERRLDFRRAFISACEIFIREKVDFIIIAGDLFHSRTPKIEDLNLVREVLYELEDNKIKIFAIYGNHDKYSLGDELGWIEYFSSYGVKRLGRFLYKNKVNIVGFDWNNNIESILLDNSIKNMYNILVLHTAIKNEITEGYGDISSDIINKHGFNYVALGHVHIRYELSNNIYNPGCIESTSNLHWNQRSGVYVVTINDDYKSQVEFHEIEKRFGFNIDIKTDWSNISNVKEHVYNHVFNKIVNIKGSMLNIILSGSDSDGNLSEIGLIHSIKESLLTLNPLYVKISNSVRPINMTLIDKDDKYVSEIDAFKSVFGNNYNKALKVHNNSHLPDEVKKIL